MLFRRLLSRPLSLLAALAGLGFALSAPAADFIPVIVLNSGSQVEIRAMPEIKGNFAYFTTTSGQEFYTRASNIDQRKTQERNADRARAADIAAELKLDAETPSNNSLGALAASEKKRRAALAPPRVVTARELERTNKTELNSVERLSGAPLPENKPDGSGAEPEPTVQPGAGNTHTITVPINFAPQPAPEAPPAPAPEDNSNNQ